MVEVMNNGIACVLDGEPFFEIALSAMVTPVYHMAVVNMLQFRPVTDTQRAYGLPELEALRAVADRPGLWPQELREVSVAVTEAASTLVACAEWLGALDLCFDGRVIPLDRPGIYLRVARATDLPDVPVAREILKQLAKVHPRH